MGIALAASLFVLRQSSSIELSVDATDGPRNLLRVTEQIPVRPGPMAISYPKWIPGNHRPSGPINEVLDFHVTSDGRELEWRRDPVEMNEIHLNVPVGADSVTVKFAVGEQPGEGWSTTLGRLRWNRVIFLPPGDIRNTMVRAEIQPPRGWTVQSALRVADRVGETVRYESVSEERLIDSPAQMGACAQTYPVGDGHFLDVLTQEKNELPLNPKIVESVRNLINQTWAIFGSRHYREYHFLATFSNYAAGAGLEHNESCEVGTREGALRSANGIAGIGSLYCHEMFHSWNGKFRRPAGLVHWDYTEPQRTELVWVYEGMTEYYGEILAARAGFASNPQALGAIARLISGMSAREGRSWRSVADTAVAASILRESGAWSNDRRQQDYYPESVSTWMLVDATIRRLTNGKKSLDDFCRAFEGGPGGRPEISSYQYSDLVRTLDKIAHYDWDGLFQRLVYSVQPEPLTEALRAAGWEMVYSDASAETEPAGPENEGNANHLGEIGIAADARGNVTDMALHSPAERAGFAIGMRIVKINGKTFSVGGFADALRRAANAPDPIRFTVEREGKTTELSADYHGGIRHPQLRRIEGTKDYLSDILAPR